VYEVPGRSIFHTLATETWQAMHDIDEDHVQEYYATPDPGNKRHYCTAIYEAFRRRIMEATNSHIDFKMDPTEEREMSNAAARAFDLFTTTTITPDGIATAVLRPIRAAMKSQYIPILQSGILALRLGVLKDYFYTAFPVEVHCASTIGITHRMSLEKLRILADTQPDKHLRIRNMLFNNLLTVPNVFFPNLANALFANEMYAAYAQRNQRLTFEQIVALGPKEVARQISDSGPIAQTLITAADQYFARKSVDTNHGFIPKNDDDLVRRKEGPDIMHRILHNLAEGTDKSILIQQGGLGNEAAERQIFVRATTPHPEFEDPNHPDTHGIGRQATDFRTIAGQAGSPQQIRQAIERADPSWSQLELFVSLSEGLTEISTQFLREYRALASAP
jgi:hypothetical protein